MAVFVVCGLMFLLTFAVVIVASALTWSVLDRAEANETQTPDEGGSGLLRREMLSTLVWLRALLSRFAFVGRLEKLLAEADFSWSVGRTVLLMLVSGAAALALLLQVQWIPAVGSWLCACAAAAAPIFYVRRRRRLRLYQVEEQLPEALEFLSRALVAGHSLPMSLELLADEVDEPLSGELRITVDEYNLGMPMNDALGTLADRLPTVDVQFFVSAVSTQSRTGGNLHEVLDGLSETIRDRAMLKGQVRALTANGRLSALVLSLLPLFVAGLMLIINKPYFMVLVESPVGKTLIFVALLAQGVAYWVINRIVDIKV